jgi:hypothetical protein
MTKYTYSDDIISDLHKDARGYRPTEFFWEEWTQSPDSVKQEVWNMLCEEMEISMKEQEAMEATALVEFRKVLRSVMDTASCNWKSALRYLADAENCDINFELDYFLWNQGIGFDDRNKISKLFKEVA